MASLASGRPLGFEGFEAIVVGIQRVNLDNEPIFARVCLSNKKLTNYIEIINTVIVAAILRRLCFVTWKPAPTDEECVLI